MQTTGFQVNAMFHDPANASSELGNLADFTQEERKPLAKVQAMRFHRQGYWVEVFNQDGELIAGPFDPDRPLPAYIF